jgi:hypothetical protein
MISQDFGIESSDDEVYDPEETFPNEEQCFSEEEQAEIDPSIPSSSMAKHHVQDTEMEESELESDEVTEDELLEPISTSNIISEPRIRRKTGLKN